MKIIQMYMICALITNIVTEDTYVVAKLPPGALAKDGEQGEDYRKHSGSKPWGSRVQPKRRWPPWINTFPTFDFDKAKSKPKSQ